MNSYHDTMLSPDECRKTILRIEELSRSARCVGIGDDMRTAIIVYSSTRYLSTEPELHQACRAIIDRVPGEFPLDPVRAAE